MPAAEVAARVRESLANLKANDLKDAQVMEVLTLAQQLTDTMQLFFGSLDQSIHKEFVYIADYIARTRTEISKLRPNDIKEQRIPTAGAELEAVVTDTERATEAIMAEAEALLDSKPDDLAAYKAQVDDAMMRVIEACSFQDLSGQRVSKVVESLRHVEKRVSRFAATMGVHDAEADEDEIAETERKKKLHLNGPAIGGPEVGQDAVDELIASDLDQNAIDALFD
ncbi:MAG: protein phosphatase CheZ [Oceanicaulis sp.]|uniref:protein phosphatase CheZ n=1 Tax=Glycocaulis sp. TaxID=1969725 RepID=UPI0025C0D1C5|nr:protein phosphatase CheZ [Glycocaulis sp.]MCC5980600.1 protein phosphatase CheZ [Oceanicaulis sp.]MCH8520345.1 protein phosphatase CheZ [Glycocaulis sp.]